jgi:hypothetical protein
MSYRWRFAFLAIVAVVYPASTSFADSTVITSGSFQMYWDSSAGGVDLKGPGTHLVAENMAGAPTELQAGQVVDLSRNVGTSMVNHPVPATVNGTTYSSVWVRGQLSVTAIPFTVPFKPVGTAHTFSTPITMTGEFFGFSDQAMTDQVFAVSLTGSGVATVGPAQVVDPNTYVIRSGGMGYQFAAAVPSPWSSADIGAVGRSGVASYDGGTLYISGSGSDIWGSEDGFHFVSQALAGDGQIIARVDDISDTNTFAKAGVMLRSSLAPDAANVILDLRPSRDIEFMTRDANGGSTQYLGGAVQAQPVWLRLVRAGPMVTASVSADGQSWTDVGSTPFPAGPSVVGLAVTSHDNGVLNTSTFDSVTVSAVATSGASDIVIYANDIPASAVHGVWTKAFDATAAAGVALTTPDGSVSNTSQPLASPADYVDVTFNALPNTPYTVWLRLLAASDSKWNDSVWVQFSDANVDDEIIYPVNSTSGLLVNLATDSAAASLNRWGWQKGAYWIYQPATVTFDDNPTHMLRIQVREDGVAFDQIVLSPVTYATAAPGPVGGDHTIIPK